jgi:hypothetical protein
MPESPAGCPCGLAGDARAGRVDEIRISEPYDTFGGARGEPQPPHLRRVRYSFLARSR